MLITIDGGTTNTRLRINDGGNILSTRRLKMGARLGLSDRAGFFRGIREEILGLLSDVNAAEEDVECVLASGMITSEGGLYNLAHIPAPAGKEELSKAILRTEIPEITKIPFALIPGVRMFGQGYADTDVMRGEETEVVGIAETTAQSCPTAYILPGSHSKLILTDEECRITDFFTLMTGEMIAALSSATILSSSVDLSDSRANGMLREGCEYAMKHGLNAALFKVRILRNFVGGSADDAYSFFLGAVLSGEVSAIGQTAPETVCIAGKAEIKHAEASLLREFTRKRVITVSDEICDRATNDGMIAVYRAV